MQKSPSIFNRVFATLIFFTRLPLWRICSPDKDSYERVVPFWPLAGWLTGMVMVLTFLLTSSMLPLGISVALTLVARLLLTGGLHEDGFADFCDGFGGGTSKNRTLEIMKDSHIGTYGVLGLVLYYLILWQTLTTLLATGITPWVMIVVDAFCKYLASTIVYFLPYARKESEAKSRIVYTRTSTSEKLLSLVLGVFPFIVVVMTTIVVAPASFNWHFPNTSLWLLAMLIPALLCGLLFRLMQRRINGYTGDCCGATFIMAELCAYICLVGVHY